MTEWDDRVRAAEDDQVAPGEDFADAAGVDPSPQEVTRYEALVAERETDAVGASGVPAAELGDEDLLRELASVHRTRDDTLRHGSGNSLAAHTARTEELETEYLRRFPDREIHDLRLRARDASDA